MLLQIPYCLLANESMAQELMWQYKEAYNQKKCWVVEVFLLALRIATPRIRVAKGSVGIGGAQTGVYPQNSSGGWNIIGKSPVNFFNTKNVAPIFAKPGDRIQFIPITLATFYEVEKEAANKTYTLKSSLL